MLGTPPTVGFFGKMLTFYLLSQNPAAPTLAALVLTLFLLVFYLQAIRAKAYTKRRHSFKLSPLELTCTTALLYGQLAMVGFSFFLPASIDIAAALFM